MHHRGTESTEKREEIIGAAIEVHRVLGPGLLESAYEECLCYELNQSGLMFQRQVHLPIRYKGILLQSAHRMDLIVEDAVIVELKALSIIILGGLGSIPGAIVGGLAFGILEAVSAGYLSSAYTPAIAFIVMMVVLMVKPSGIIGEITVEKV